MISDKEESPYRLCESCLDRYHAATADGALTGATEEPPHCLIRFGLLHPSDDGTFHVPVPPSVAAAWMLAQMRTEIRAREDRLAELTKIFDTAETVFTVAQRHRASSTLIEGASVISAALAAAVDACKDELLTAQPGGGRPPALLDRARQRDVALLRRGVRQRTLYQHAARRNGPTMDYIRRVTAAGGQVRTLDQLSDRLIICDQSVAYVPTGPRRAHRALEIRDKAIIQFLVRVFEDVWLRAIPVSESGEPLREQIVDDLNLSIMRRLVGGCTDAKIARDLGMSPRTVAEHVARISRRLGSTSRAQLGYLIAVSGVLDTDHHPNAR